MHARNRADQIVAGSTETAHLVDAPRLLGGRQTGQSDRELCGLLEQGKILYFPKSPFPLTEAEIDVLLRQRQSNRRWHKNIAYRPLKDRLTGFDPKHVDFDRLHQVMRTFSRQTLAYVSNMLPSYARVWRLDYASFRPLEEKGRQLRLHARNDLIHVDSFPKRPTFGDRILRIFMNINPHAERHWITGEAFDVLAREMGSEFVRQFVPGHKPTLWRRMATSMRLPLRPFSPYDQAMRDIHQLMKESESFQNTCRKFHSHFPPGSAWLVFTDSVPHAVVSGQYALEQTVIVPRGAMVSPEKAPAAVLEFITARPPARAA